MAKRKGNIAPFRPHSNATAVGSNPLSNNDKEVSTRRGRQSTTGARFSDAAPNFVEGLAAAAGQPDGPSALQRAAKKRLFGGKPGSFAADYARNT